MSDDLIGRADSLMRRSRSFVAGRVAPVAVDDGIPLLTETVDLDALMAERENRSAEVIAAVTAEVTERVTAEVTERVTAEVTGNVTEQVSQEVAAQVRQQLQYRTSKALSREFADLPGVLQQGIDDWCSSTLPVLVSMEMQAALEAVLGSALEHAAARIREQAVLDLREQIVTEIEKRSQAVLNATVHSSDEPDQPL